MADLEQDSTPEGSETTGALTACALLRGETKAALRHRFKELKGTAWGRIAEALAGSNGNGADRLLKAMRGLRIPGYTEDDTRRHMLASIGRFDSMVEAWLDLDPIFTQRRLAPTRTVEDVEGMFNATEWLWPLWIPKGYLSLLVGRPGCGKSYVAAWLATHALSPGGRYPDGTDTNGDPDRDVLWIDTEGTTRLLVERLNIMAGPKSRFRWPLDPKNRDEDFPIVNLADPRWIGIIADVAMAKRPIWIVVDSLRGAHNLDENSSDMQAMLGAAAALARDLDCAFTFVHHLRKATQFERLNEVSMDQIRGSTAIVAMHRVILALDQPDPTSQNQRLRVIKSNLSQFPDPIGIHVGEHGPTVIDSPPAAPMKRSALDEAAEFLQSRLEPGPRLAADLLDEGRAHCISEKSIQRAKKTLGLIVIKVDKHWQWSLPARPGQGDF